MPYQQQCFVSVASHDIDTWEVYVVHRTRVASRRISVHVPRNSSREAIYNAAVGLAIFVRLENNADNVFVRKDHIYNALRQAALRARADEERRNRPAVAARPRVEYIHPDRPTFETARAMAPTAEAVARELLRSIDPALLSKIEAGVAFYFITPSYKYIWYPRQRAIVSLDDDMPRYVCVHSRDVTVEANTYDWAITMRTYLLGAETAWRNKANFHQEYNLRGGADAYARTQES